MPSQLGWGEAVALLAVPTDDEHQQAGPEEKPGQQKPKSRNQLPVL